MKKYAKYFLLATGTLGLVMVAVSITRVSATSAQSQGANADTPAQAGGVTAHWPKPTPIKRGVMSEKQRTHSRLLDVNPGGKRLTDLAAQSPAGEGVFLKQGPGLIELPYNGGGGNGVAAKRPSLEDLVRKSDVVAVAVVKDAASQLTQSERAVFTDYDLAAKKVFKDDAKALLPTAGRITFTHIGGSVLLDGRVISFTPPDELLLKQNGTYLLFLTSIPETGAYRVTDEYGAFEIVGDDLVPATSESLVPAELSGKRNAQAVFNRVMAIASGREAPGGGK
ncbi:MAG: hypothetical protein M3444_10495 [Acidobacteriota bacterium]|nr:hypothetical protein [Acidobacteriota bacterium]